MNEIRDLHHRAMEFAEKAAIAKIGGNVKAARGHLKKAFELEKEAAKLCDLSFEPTRSVLFRSAAYLALQNNKACEAEKLVAQGLSGDPPDEIADELRDLFEQVTLERHLSLRGIALDPYEIQLSLAGKAVGFGLVLAEEFIGRAQALEKMIYRTAERQLGLAYSETSSVRQKYPGEYDVCFSTPRAASFAITVRIGKPTDQPTLFSDADVQSINKIVDSVFKGLEIVNEGNLDDLQSVIGDEAYRRNFVGLAKRLAPDGDSIKLVGLTALHGKEERVLPFTRPRGRFGSTVRERESKAKRTEVTGYLKFADDRPDQVNKTIRVVSADGKETVFVVPAGMMADIVRPLWDSLIVATGSKKGRSYQLDDIKRA